MNKGTLYLLPSTMAEESINKSLVPYAKEIIDKTIYFIVENEKTARKFLKEAGIKTPQNDLQIEVYDKRSKGTSALQNYIAPLLAGHDIALLSEAGCPAIADPGAEIVAYAHRKGINVVPIVGPSSIILSLMASGFNGQSFAFHGYIPINKGERIQKIHELEKASVKLRQTQLFIETPFRNNHLLDDILNTCQASTELSISCDLTSGTEFIGTKTMAEWKKSKPDLHKRPTIFLLYKRF